MEIRFFLLCSPHSYKSKKDMFLHYSSQFANFLHFNNLVYPIINKFNITFTSE